MNIYDLGGLIVSMITVSGVIWASGRISEKVEQNTKATEQLNGTMADFSKETREDLRNLDVRVSVLEGKVKK